MRRYDDAIPDLSHLIAADPTDVSLRLERATLADQIQRSDRAIDDYKSIIDTQTGNVTALAGAGTVAYERGDFAGAQVLLEAAARRAPTDASVARRLAAVYAERRQYPEARDQYDRAISLDPADAQTYAERAAFLRFAGLDDAPVPDLNRVLVLASDVNQHQWAANLLEALNPPHSYSSERS
jgi:tetratricopeptide (TPR) repeat protein